MNIAELSGSFGDTISSKSKTISDANINMRSEIPCKPLTLIAGLESVAVVLLTAGTLHSEVTVAAYARIAFAALIYPPWIASTSAIFVNSMPVPVVSALLHIVCVPDRTRSAGRWETHWHAPVQITVTALRI